MSPVHVAPAHGGYPYTVSYNERDRSICLHRKSRRNAVSTWTLPVADALGVCNAVVDLIEQTEQEQP